jgi:hypothetical protein
LSLCLIYCLILFKIFLLFTFACILTFFLTCRKDSNHFLNFYAFLSIFTIKFLTLITLIILKLFVLLSNYFGLQHDLDIEIKMPIIEIYKCHNLKKLLQWLIIFNKNIHFTYENCEILTISLIWNLILIKIYCFIDFMILWIICLTILSDFCILLF